MSFLVSAMKPVKAVQSLAFWPDCAPREPLDVGRRIEQGVQSGQLTNREAGKLERGQARVNRAEARAGADGHVGPNEQRRIQKAENRQSKRIYREKHDAQKR